MKAIGKLIRNVILLVILFGFGTAGIDYYRMTKGFVPIFNRSYYYSQGRIQEYRGLFYKAERHITSSTRESLEDSKDIQFQLFQLKYKIPSTKKNDTIEYTLDVQKSEMCSGTSLLYYADLDVKVYTYCIDDIQIKGKNQGTLSEKLSSDKDFLQDLYSRLSYQGLLLDGKTQFFNSNETFAKEGVTLYRCNDGFIQDVYITPLGTSIQPDFCTYKDDDFMFIYEVVDEFTGEVSDDSVPEVLYEDDTYRYEFDTYKSPFVFVTTPAVRGKVETKTPIRTVLDSGILTIDQLIDRGLVINKVDKAKEAEELLKAQESESAQPSEDIPS